MSYSELWEMPKSGPIQSVRKFANSWGWAMRVWDAMGKRYLGLENFPLSYEQGARDVWALWKRTDIPRAHRAAMLMTFDNAVTEWEHLGEAAGDLRQFEQDFPPGDRISHLVEIAQEFDRLAALNRQNMFGVCFYGMSVSENPWWIDETREDDEEEDDEDEGRYFDYERDAAGNQKIFGVYTSLNDPRDEQQDNEGTGQ